jgi:hypothetical protein
VDVTVRAAVREEGAAEVFESVKTAACYGVARDHGVERKITGAVVDDEAEIGGMRFWNGTYWHAIHPR